MLIKKLTDGLTDGLQDRPTDRHTYKGKHREVVTPTYYPTAAYKHPHARACTPTNTPTDRRIHTHARKPLNTHHKSLNLNGIFILSPAPPQPATVIPLLFTWLCQLSDNLGYLSLVRCFLQDIVEFTKYISCQESLGYGVSIVFCKIDWIFIYLFTWETGFRWWHRQEDISWKC